MHVCTHICTCTHTKHAKKKDKISVLKIKLRFSKKKKKKTVEKINRQVTVWEKIICKTHLRRLTPRTEDSLIIKKYSWSLIIKSPQEPRETSRGCQDAPVGSSKWNAHSPQWQAPRAQQNSQNCWRAGTAAEQPQLPHAVGGVNAQPGERNVWELLIKLNIYLTYDPAFHSKCLPKRNENICLQKDLWRMFITAYSQQLKREKTPGVHPQESGYQTVCPHKETLLSNTQAQTTASQGTDKPDAKLSRRTQTHTDCPYPTSRAVKPELNLKKTRQWLPLGVGPRKGDGDGPRPERTLPVCGRTHWPQVITQHTEGPSHHM